MLKSVEWESLQFWRRSVMGVFSSLNHIGWWMESFAYLLHLQFFIENFTFSSHSLLILTTLLTRSAQIRNLNEIYSSAKLLSIHCVWLVEMDGEWNQTWLVFVFYAQFKAGSGMRNREWGFLCCAVEYHDKWASCRSEELISRVNVNRLFFRYRQSEVSPLNILDNLSYRKPMKSTAPPMLIFTNGMWYSV